VCLAAGGFGKILNTAGRVDRADPLSPRRCPLWTSNVSLAVPYVRLESV
jgi:hypothetical protein